MHGSLRVIELKGYEGINKIIFGLNISSHIEKTMETKSLNRRLSIIMEHVLLQIVCERPNPWPRVACMLPLKAVRT